MTRIHRVRQLAATAAAAIGEAGCGELGECSAIAGQSVLLIQDLAVPLERMAFESVQDLLGRPRYAARSVEVVDAYQPASTAVARVDETGDRRAQRSQVQWPAG